METVNIKKPSVSTSPAGVPYASHLYPPLPQWPLPPHQQGQISNQPTQPHLQAEEKSSRSASSIQTQPPQVPQTGCQQNHVQLPYWNTTDYPAQAAAVAGHCHPFTPRSSDSNWQPPSFGSFQANSNALFGFPGGYNIPGGVGQSGFPGLWDPSYWYGQQPAAGYAPAAYHAYFSYRAPGVIVGVGGSGTSSVQKGMIKPPHGLSHKHQRLWEAQSAENMQLWAALTRAEVEMGAQHNKILLLEADLQLLKPPQEAPSLAAPSQPFKRVRKKKLSSQFIASCAEGAMSSKSRGRKPSNSKISKSGKPDLYNEVETAIKLDETDFLNGEKINCSLLIDMLKSVDEKSNCAELNAELPPSTRGSGRITDALFRNDPLSETGKNELVLHCETYFSHSDGNNKIVNGHIKEGDARALTKPLTKESDRLKEGESDSRTMDTAVGIFCDANMKTIQLDARSSSNFSHAPAMKAGNVSSDNAMPSWGYASGDASDEQDAGQDDEEDEVVNEDEEYDLSENREVDATETVTGRMSGELPQLNGWKDL